MRVVIQRVSSASVAIENNTQAQIGAGLLILLGICENDTQADIDWLTSKIIALRIFNDAEGKMNLSVKEVNGELLIVSQFTLFADTKKGNRPSFIRAAKPAFAMPLYHSFIKQCQTQLGKEVATGIFGADMKINLVNDGPVTIIIDSKNKEF
jgi:D-tyrosyl-tRNA(Tyr) deacylase